MHGVGLVLAHRGQGWGSSAENLGLEVRLAKAGAPGEDCSRSPILPCLDGLAISPDFSLSTFTGSFQSNSLFLPSAWRQNLLGRDSTGMIWLV